MKLYVKKIYIKYQFFLTFLYYFKFHLLKKIVINECKININSFNFNFYNYFFNFHKFDSRKI